MSACLAFFKLFFLLFFINTQSSHLFGKISNLYHVFEAIKLQVYITSRIRTNFQMVSAFYSISSTLIDDLDSVLSRFVFFLIDQTMFFSILKFRQDFFDRKERRMILISKKLKNKERNLRYSRLFCGQPRFLHKNEQRILLDDVILTSSDKS